MQIMVDCCAMDDSACTALKMEFPELASPDPDMNPDFCAMHGNVCSRHGAALLRSPPTPFLDLCEFAKGRRCCSKLMRAISSSRVARRMTRRMARSRHVHAFN